MNCDDFSKRVSTFSDRDLPSAEREALEQHAGVCPPCGRELLVYRTMRDGFALLPRVNASDTLESRILQRIEREAPPAHVRSLLLPWDITGWMRPVGLAMAAGLLVFVVGRGVLRLPADDAAGNRSAIVRTDETGAQPAVESPRDLQVAQRQSNGSAQTAARDSAPAGVAVDERALARLLGEEGIPLLPLGAERNYVIDRPEDVPGLMPGWGEGEPVSTPIF